MIKVSVSIQFLAEPPDGQTPIDESPEIVTLQVPQGTSAYDILILASKENAAYTFTSTDTSPYGHFITSMDGVYEDKSKNKYWMMYEDPDTLAPVGVDSFHPQDGSNTIFKYQIAKSNVELF